ncbi:FGGY-family carbohydrate kinase [Tychonema sp. BBK16]|uniref:FGGY-family carbohydrate kinase n=1 Tax=Tychonema sp. BBK16 TaxID=2699888 RepID=UPI001F1DC80C|nr:FGGY-family carbohydrate kinase [Tychonema sp. BBK16]MCF6374446.1 FGGY-family carbohydrate kinase [Tychonema sp. BBK16]
MNFYLGIDFGTTGVRSTAIDSNGNIHSESEYNFGPDESASELSLRWENALWAVIEQIPLAIRSQVRSIAIDGTSSTVMLCDTKGIPVSEPILYNDGRGVAVLDRLRAIAPANHTVLNATSSLAKLLWWLEFENTEDAGRADTAPRFFLHQADWLSFLLHGKLGVSDYHNALKLGYDVANLCYPNWLTEGIAGVSKSSIAPILPQVVAPGIAIGPVTAEICDRFGFSRDCIVCGGTTDSIAAFLASGVNSPGEAVTSLGSTLVIKLLSYTRVDDARYGIYSHRFTSPLQGGAGGGLWLVGGASNTGGAVLRHFFTDTELDNYSRQIDPEQESLLDYYPLLKKGDRFPNNNPNLLPRLEPRPANPVEFLHGLLESIARIEARGYELLQELGATPLTKVYTAGGGAKNLVWSGIRERYLKVPVVTSVHTAASYGSALLAMDNVNQF